jgi:hypothetical protein
LGIVYRYFKGADSVLGYPRFFGVRDTLSGLPDSLRTPYLSDFRADSVATRLEYAGYVWLPADSDYVFAFGDTMAAATATFTVQDQPVEPTDVVHCTRGLYPVSGAIRAPGRPKKLVFSITCNGGPSGALLYRPKTVGTNYVVAIFRPSQGESYRAGDTVHVRFATDLAVLPNVRLDVSPNAGEVWSSMMPETIAANKDAWGDYVWTIPDSAMQINTTTMVSMVSTECTIRIADYGLNGPKTGLSEQFSVTAR